MATVTPGIVWVSGETVTPAKLNSAAAPTVVVASDEITTAKILDAAVTQAKLASNVTTTGPAFRAYATSATTGFLNGVDKKVDLTTESYDTANCFASSRFTPNVAGYYLIHGAIRWENITAANALIYKNGVIHSSGSHGNVGTYQSNTTDLVYLNGTTDYVELWGVQYSGTTQSTSGNNATTYLSGFLARAA